MPYDLYGQHYASQRDAENAEMAQCAAIDADIANRGVQKLRQQFRMMGEPNGLDMQVDYLMQKVEELEKRINILENNQNQTT
jgi:hypothetical protein